MDEMRTELWKRLLEIPGVEEGENSFGIDTALWVNGMQIANFRRDGGLELRLSRPLISQMKARLTADKRVALRGNSDWAGFRFRSANDFDFLVEMAGLAAKVYLPKDGSAPAPPPSAEEVARQKFYR